MNVYIKVCSDLNLLMSDQIFGQSFANIRRTVYAHKTCITQRTMQFWQQGQNAHRPIGRKYFILHLSYILCVAYRANLNMNGGQYSRLYFSILQQIQHSYINTRAHTIQVMVYNMELTANEAEAYLVGGQLKKRKRT